ncbi:Monooxygenase AgnL5-like protein [Cladobotryum mycophilum]|uniref:Monooxygenase AgnL5-like protein n=1 Tax=Cladobotryum mycophilum TaxID=491253 RepID=A0ABR0SW52_9HYPO
MSTIAEKQLATAKALFDGYNEYTADAVLRVRAPECVHAIWPTSLNRPSKTNDEYREFFGPLQKLMKNYEVKIHKIINDAENHMLALYATGRGESAAAPYQGEYVFFLTFTEDGEKITLIEQFVDSAFAQSYLVKVREYNEKNAA